MNSILYFAINTNLAHYPTIKSYNKELAEIPSPHKSLINAG